MATGGWGGAYSNPFAQTVARDAGQAAATAAADSAQTQARSAFTSAWGGNTGGSSVPPPVAPSAPAAPMSREADLAAREAELARREQALAARGGSGGVLKNWPPCCPFVYHNIAEQIPPWHRSAIRFHYLIEMLSVAAFFYNAIVLLAALFAGVGPGLQWWFLSLLALVLGVPLSWWLFYKSFFASATTDGRTYSYIRTFLLIMLHMAWCVWMVLAIDNLGSFSAGVFPMLRLFQRGDARGIALGIMYIINVAAWGLAAFGCWISLGLAVAAYRKGDTPRKDYEQRMGGLQMGTTGAYVNTV